MDDGEMKLSIVLVLRPIFVGGAAEKPFFRVKLRHTTYP